MRCKCGRSAPISGSFLDFDVLQKATHCRIKFLEGAVGGHDLLILERQEGESRL